jgi:hypothetical protein
MTRKQKNAQAWQILHAIVDIVDSLPIGVAENASIVNAIIAVQNRLANDKNSPFTK